MTAAHSVVELFPRAADGDPRWGSPIPVVDGNVRSVDVIGPVKGKGLQISGFTQTPVTFPAELEDKCWDKWAGAGNLQYVSPETFSEFALPRTLEAVFANDLQRPSEHKLGTFERMDEFVSLVMPGRDAEDRLFSHYADALSRVPAGNIVNWQYYMFERAVSIFGPGLKERGVIQTFHAHDPVPDNLVKSEWGREFLQGLSLMDVVYLHTDRYAANLERQLTEMNLPHPIIRRFDLGIDRGFIDRGLSQVTTGNAFSFFDQTTPLSERQREFIREVFSSAATGADGMAQVKHRFISLDRIVPI